MIRQGSLQFTLHYHEKHIWVKSRPHRENLGNLPAFCAVLIEQGLNLRCFGDGILALLQLRERA